MDDYKSATDLFGAFRFITVEGSERGELLKYFSEKTKRPIKFIAFKLTGISTPDLYYIKKQCDRYNGPWAKAFFGMLKVKPPNGGST